MRESKTRPFPDTVRSQERAVASALWSAMADRDVIEPPRLLVAEADLAAGYRIQAINVERAISSGQRKVGYKIAMTSVAIQRQFGLDHPTSGTLFDHRVRRSAAILDRSSLKQGRLEGEIAFEMAAAIADPGITLAVLSRAVRRALPAVEIINSRVRAWDVTPFDFVADNSAAELIVLGDTEVPFAEADLARVQMQVTVNGSVRSRGSGGACLGNPLIALQWLAVHLIEQGTPLQADDIVMSGSLGPALPFEQGDHVEMSVGAAAPVCLHFK